MRPTLPTDSRLVLTPFDPERTVELFLPTLLLLRSLFALSIELILSDLKDELRTLPVLLDTLPLEDDLAVELL